MAVCCVILRGHNITHGLYRLCAHYIILLQRVTSSVLFRQWLSRHAGSFAKAGGPLVGCRCEATSDTFRKTKETLCPALLTPAACVTLLVFGVLLVLPFLILGLAGYARIVRCFKLSSCFLPYSRAMYQGTVPQRRPAKETPKDGKAWV
ncbi:transmembrane protein 88 isoform X2 [Hyla sarda]|uniref:transmembrane protein 88 isoform X2 n=1 Tax=Hyla sarda TaxID=327740 RepID=UPI0024C3E22B|nr:transmembrane protein 88 isoform X2 [Hyla sarda]